jgi:methionyl-tRNA formyltransferase
MQATNNFMNRNRIEKPLILLVGNGPTALAALRSLTPRFRVGGVVREECSEDPVRAYAACQNIPVFALRREEEIAALVSKARPDAVVISSYNRILSPQVLRLSQFVNVHYSPLPRYRGRANVNWALINGERTAAISIHRILPGLDSGNLLYQEEVVIGALDTAGSIYERLNAIQERVLADVVLRMLGGDEGRPQDHSKATYGCGRIPGDGEIDWCSTTYAIDRLIRALAPPFPGAFTYFDFQPLVVSQATCLEEVPFYEGRVPGRVICRSSADGWVDVLTGDGVLRLVEVVDSSGRPFPPARLIKSTRATLGLSRQDLLHRINTLEARLVAVEKMVSAKPDEP